MTNRLLLTLVLAALMLGGCSKDAETAKDTVAETAKDKVADTASSQAAGLVVRKIQNGYGRTAQAGDFVTVHYTGWLYDQSAPDNRGEKFDSSVDRGQKFQFPLGAGRVIKGWDQGVAGMQIGETRELIIPADLGYGDRGAGNAIPPGATLVFEVELFGAEAPEASQ